MNTQVEIKKTGTTTLATAGKYCDRNIDVNVDVTSDEFYDAFWDSYQANGTRTNYLYAFSRLGWTDITFKPKYDIVPTGVVTSMFQGSQITGDPVKIMQDSGLVLDFSNCTGFAACFQESVFTRIGLINCANATTVNNIFAWNNNITTIDKIILSEKITNYTNAFVCPKLANIRVEGTIAATVSFSSCSLTAESAKSIISCLKNLSGTGEEHTKTITFNTTTWGYLDAEGNASPDGTTWRDYIGTTLKWNT